MSRSHVIDPLDADCDDLKSLVGIGEHYAEALHRIGIHTYADLARYTPRGLSRALAEHEHLKVSEKRIDSGNWISQARAAMAAKALPHPVDTPNPVAKPPAQRWRGHTCFTISFEKMTDASGAEQWRTGLYCDDGEEAFIDDTDAAVWSRWVIERARLPQPSSRSAAVQSSEMHLEVLRLQTQLAAVEALGEKTRSQLVHQKHELAQALAAMEAMRLKQAQDAESARQTEQALAAARAQCSQLQRERDDLLQERAARASEADVRSPAARRESQTGTLAIGPITVTTQPSAKAWWLRDLVIDVHFALPDRGVELTAEPSPFLLEVVGVYDDGHKSLPLAKLDDTLRPNQREHTYRLVCEMPEPNTYTLMTQLTLAEPLLLTGTSSGPAVTIMP